MRSDTELFDRLYHDNRMNFIAIARSYVEETSVAEDIVTEAFVTWWLRRSSIPQEVDPRRYIVGIIKKQCLEHLRSLQIQARIHKNIWDTNRRMREYHIASLENDASESLHTEELLAIIRRQLAGMPALTRSVFTDSRIEGLSHREIAERLSIPERKVKYELKKALDSLRHSLKDYLPGLLIGWVLEHLIHKL